MKYSCKSILLGFLLLLLTGVPAMGQDTSLILEDLKKEGFRPQIDEDGDIVFKVAGDVYLICFRKKDPEYIALRKYIHLGKRVTLPVYKLANNITLQYVIGQCTIIGDEEDSLLISIESFEDWRSFKQHLERYLQIIQEMEQAFSLEFKRIN